MAADPSQPISPSEPHPPSGASATTHAPAASSNSRMTGNVDFSEDTAISPNSQFPTSHPAQYSQNPYTFARGTGSFGVDQDMSMVENFTQGIQHDLNGLRGSISSNNGHQGGSMRVSTSSNQPGMAPPQTPHGQSFSSPTNARPSLDGSQDLTNNGEGTKRKRSKVSRACDECRRKKIRCDAQDDEGNIKTCSNCTRASQTCEYSRIPMKRGPSKGYIKELSERVQMVESQMAVSGGPGYRQSIDGNLPMYPESSYSPDEHMSLKRNFSFSEGRTNPFAQPQFTNRDRMPSMGGWSNTSAGMRPRDHGSIAVAPDQLPDHLLVNGQPPLNFNYSKPFWAQEGAEMPPAKRLRTSDEDDISTAAIDDEALTSDVNLIAARIPIFPTADTTNIIKSSPRRLQHALGLALRMVSRRTQMPNNAFKTYSLLEEYAWDQARISPEMRSSKENMVWLWLYILMAVLADQDIGRLHGSSVALSKSNLIKLAMDLGQHLRRQNEIDVTKAWNFTLLLTRIHTLSTGTEDAVSGSMSIDESELPDQPISYLIRASEILPMVATSVQAAPTPTLAELNSRNLINKLVYQHLRLIELPPGPTEQTQAVKEFRLFIELLLTRQHFSLHPAQIMQPALQVVSLLSEKVKEEEAYSWGPLDVHLFTLATITLLEFFESRDQDLVAQAGSALERLKGPVAGSKGQSEVEGYPVLSLANGLLKIIDAKRSAANGHANGESGEAVQQLQPATGELQAIDFRMLCRMGWMNVLARLCEV